MTKLMGRGRTHAVATESARTGKSRDEVEEEISEEVAQKMNLGLSQDEVFDLADENENIDSRQIVRPSDVNALCSEDEEMGRMECVVAVDDVPWF
jgi:tRNA U34 5-carboxymethylaminomethyl modifying enzyme MnmG/GidA